MPLIRVRNALIAANSINYPLAGNQYEFLPFNAMVEFAIIASAITTDVQVFSGSDVLQQGGPAALAASANAPPKYPDDFLLSDMALAGERISVVVRETGNVATTNVDTAVKITPA